MDDLNKKEMKFIEPVFPDCQNINKIGKYDKFDIGKSFITSFSFDVNCPDTFCHADFLHALEKAKKYNEMARKEKIDLINSEYEMLLKPINEKIKVLEYKIYLESLGYQITNPIISKGENENQ